MYYCNWLNMKNGIPVSYNDNGELLNERGTKTTEIADVIGYRLPTEAEWEYAAKGGQDSEGYTYSGCNAEDILDFAWYYANSGSTTLTAAWSEALVISNNCQARDISQKTDNELGLYDMSGNVWEWCTDYYSSSYSSDITNPCNLTNNSYRVTRGGGFNSPVEYLTNTYRSNLYEGSTNNAQGFRVVSSVSVGSF